ncbi:hypothetical protein PVMG_06145 [Plasmodium vivax Mauritania I]|uniref:Fam-l protein n=1 Tax=Plasmodium vivax Mauritania I TaxID=1035515 RepID=A0A0J9TCM7_PLAVI|nr:hypothetical protein PVMG_06145 [Plasmodium vivax Mauritania I]
MVQLSSKILGKKVNFAVLMKKLTFVFLTWTCFSYIDMGTFSKSLENKYEHDKILNISFYRLLARHEQHRELRDTGFKDKLPDRSLHKNKRNVSDHIPTYSEVRSKASNNFDLYMKNYKERYMKKKGLSKLDCYYENKLFCKFCHIRDIAEIMQNDKKRWKNFFLKKYGIGLILFSLIPALGFIDYILFGVDDWGEGIIKLCNVSGHDSSTASCPKLHKDNWETPLKYICFFNMLFTVTMMIIVLSFVIYTWLKVTKYVRLKSGKYKIV